MWNAAGRVRVVTEPLVVRKFWQQASLENELSLLHGRAVPKRSRVPIRS